MKDVDYTLFLKSSRPEQKIRAVLGKFDQLPPEHALKHIVQELKKAPKAGAGRYFRQLRIPAQLRNLNLNFIEDMGADQSCHAAGVAAVIELFTGRA